MKRRIVSPLVLSMIQLLWDRAEGNGYAHHMTTDPLPNTPAHTVLMHPAFADLTEQERRVLAHIADGETNRQIAARMGLAEKTVRNYVSNVLAKLELESRAQAAGYAIRNRLPELEDREA